MKSEETSNSATSVQSSSQALTLNSFNSGQGQVQRFNNHTALYRTHTFMYWMGWVKAIFEALATFDPKPLSVHVNSHNWAAVRLSETQQMPSCPWSWDRPPHWQSREQRPRAANPAVEPTSHRNRAPWRCRFLWSVDVVYSVELKQFQKRILFMLPCWAEQESETSWWQHHFINLAEHCPSPELLGGSCNLLQSHYQ